MSRQLLLLAAVTRGASAACLRQPPMLAARPPLIHSFRMSTTPADKAPPEARSAPAALPPPRFGELLKFTVLAMPIYVAPTLLSLIDTAAVGQAPHTC